MKNRKNTATGIMGLMLLAAVGMSGWQYWKTNQPAGVAILGVLDGDTVVLEGTTRFRLRNIDAPESDLCGGKEAKAQLEKLVKGKRVRTEEVIIDQWGRPLGLLYTGKVLINREMLKSGWAKFHSDQTTINQEMKEINDANKKDNKGMYGRCWQTENLDKPKCNVKGNIDPEDESLRRYYVPGCVQYNTTIVELDRGENWFCSEAEAKKAGYVKSKRCP